MTYKHHCSSALEGWFAGRLPDDWFTGRARSHQSTARRSSSSAPWPNPIPRGRRRHGDRPRPAGRGSNASARTRASSACDRRRGRAPHRPQGRVGRAVRRRARGLHEPRGPRDDTAAHERAPDARHVGRRGRRRGAAPTRSRGACDSCVSTKASGSTSCATRSLPSTKHAPPGRSR